MKKGSRRTAQDDSLPGSPGGPDVSTIIETMEESRAALLTELRGLALALPGVEERTLYDGFCRHWTPAYYSEGAQLFHVHNFRAGLRATMFVGARKLEPVILDSDQVPHELRLLVAQTPGPRGRKEVRVPIGSLEDVASFWKLVRVKWELGR
jgi:hypothetical protein